MTTPIARLVASRMREEPLPLKLAYISNVFRSEQAQAGRQCEFNQGGVELIGTSAVAADAEVIALAIEGKQLTSEELAAKIDGLGLHGTSHIQLIIGGSLGLDPSILQRADYLLSFSRMTFPHQLMRVILLEQIYRAYKINAGEPYHK